jgi:tetratricopeptide (TPR) repeat protein
MTHEGAAAKVFISRAGADAEFAAVIGGILEAAGYAVTLQQWDFANRNFVERMHAALSEGGRVVALLSPEYLRSAHCQAEWQNAIADDPLNTEARLILLRVVECEPIGLLRGLAYWDLVSIRDDPALIEQTVRDAVREGRRDAAPSGPYWRAPRTIVDSESIHPVSSFSGRDAELTALSTALDNDGSIAVLHGLGGVGKSSVAREYASRNRDHYSVIWWLNAETEDGIVEGLLRLGALFARGLDQLEDRRAAASQVIGSILSGFAKPVLLIFDNVEDERLLRRWQPRAGSRVLVTSRNASWRHGVAVIGIGAWGPQTAIDYLQRESGRAELTGADARAIAEALGGLPLALSHAAASLRNTRMVTAQRYLERIGEHLRRAPRDAEYPSSIFATFSAAIAQAEQQAPGAAAVLCLAASFAPDAIPDELLRQPAGLCPDGLRPVVPGADALDLRSALADDLALDDALGALDRLGLLTFAPASQTYGMHRLVQLAAQDLASDAALVWRESAAAFANSAFPNVEFATWPQCERLLSHARAALDALPSDVDSLSAARLANRYAIYLRQRGDYSAPELLHARALAIHERLDGRDHIDVAKNLNNLAVIYWDQGRYREAEPLHTRALAIREKTLGPEHPDVAVSLNNLANVYQNQGRYAEAGPLHARALAIREKALGPEHPDVAISLHNLALVCSYQGRHADAEPLHARALSLLERSLGPDHPLVAHSLSNLAAVYASQGRYAEAEPLHARALTILEQALGQDHPHVAVLLNDLAVAYSGQGRYAEAGPLHARALEILEKKLGPHHPDVAHSLNDLANAYGNQRRYADAEPLYVRALAIREKSLGADHPLTKATREALDALRSRSQ